ncbi:hypothetical protein TIFTF001_025040 [Ficus carica]|uniref:Uncharacterized protein n=1 Tax=Ficus carica TaxID=3494 RepID=A0AA88AJ12_FICCA|nr:hypothetical protein TIFTF001_025040 [Ficus carica]
MSDFNKTTATSSPPKNFICPFCNRSFIFASQNHVAPPQPENAPKRGRSAPRNRRNYPMPNPTLPAGGPTEIAKSFEGTVTNPIDAGEEVSSKKEEDVDLELKL